MSGWTRIVSGMNGFLVAPGASRAELAISYGAAVLGAATALIWALASGANPLQVAVLTVFGSDIAGGVVVNATAAAQRRFAEGPGWRKRALVFVAAHVHLFVLAAVFPEQSWWNAALIYAGLLLSAVLITSADALRRPVAFFCAAALVMLAEATGPAEPYLGWVAPLLVIKLLLAHLLAGSVRR